MSVLSTGGGMQRREFIALIFGATAAWPATTYAQQTGRLSTVGFLGASASGFAPWAAAFAARLRDLGWVESRTVAIEYRWSKGRCHSYGRKRCPDCETGDNGYSHRLCCSNRSGRQRPRRKSCETWRQCNWTVDPSE